MKTLLITILIIIMFVVNLYGEEHVVPFDIIPKHKLLSTRHFGNDTENRCGEFIFSFSMKRVTIFWKWRLDVSDDWKSKEQFVDSTYEILEALAPINEYMYVVGISDQGETIVERWKFVYSLPYKITIEGEEPVVDWSLPQIKKKELYRGTELTHICDLSSDPKGRFLLLFTWESRTVYQMDINTGHYTYLFGPTELPEIQMYRRISPGNHVTEGYIYSMYRNASWQPFYPKGNAVLVNGERYVWVSDTVIFRDQDRNGILDSQSLEYITRQTNIEREYHDSTNWTHF